MAIVTVVRNIRSPAPIVFQEVADPRRFAQVITGVTQLDFLSEMTPGVGTRRRQTRVLHGKEMTMEFEVTLYHRCRQRRAL